MEKHKYKIGDIVIIKSFEWYRKNCNALGEVNVKCSCFVEPMSEFCGMKMRIKSYTLSGYIIDDCSGWEWSDEMFESIKVIRKLKLKRLKCLK